MPDDLQTMRDALTTLRSFDLREINVSVAGRGDRRQTASMDLSQLERFLRELEELLPSWSNNLSSRYFSHARTLPINVGQ